MLHSDLADATPRRPLQYPFKESPAMKKAFTLIELLIVVAIIAILAAIAVPNFLEAQTRSKVSRFMADLRSMSVGVEAYVVDHNRYPPPDAVPASPQAGACPDPWWEAPEDAEEGFLSRRLTTPIAYVTALPWDIFPSGERTDACHPLQHPPHYVNDQFNMRTYASPFDQFYVARAYTALKVGGIPNMNALDRSVVWMAQSHGPDMQHSDFGGGGFPVAYDPTNGTISAGDIFYFGPGVGFFGR